MKALTLWQPWASLIAAGVKHYETRGWRPSAGQLPVGEELAIHAGMRILRDLPPDLEALLSRLDLRRPLGSVVCVCRYNGAVPTEELREWVGETELACGDWTPGRWAWELRVLRVFDGGIQACGARGLWDWHGEARGVAAMGGWWRCAACGVRWLRPRTQCPECGGTQIARGA